MIAIQIAILCASINAATPNTTNHTKTENAEFFSSNDSTLVLTVSDMECKTDSKLVETALYRKVGIKSVRIEGETITVVYNPKRITSQEIIKVIENTGTCEDPNARVHKVKIKFS